MFITFPSALRRQGLDADVRTLLHLYKLMSCGLVSNLGELYSFGERLVVKQPRQKGPYTVAFFAHFLGIHIQPGQALDEAVILSDVFYNWRLEHAPGRMPSAQLVSEFLDSVLNQSPDLKSLAATLADLLPNPPIAEVPFLPSGDEQDTADTDYSDLDLEEIVKRMTQIAEEQTEAHSGGQKYIGNRGSSPYGHNGRSSSGIRVGGESAHLTARMVLSDPRYFPLDMNALLSDSNMDAALAALKGIAEHSSRLELDLDETIRQGARRGGLILPHLKDEEDERLHVMLFIDNGGYSMDPYVPSVRNLFQKMKTRYGHDLRIFYFHNILGATVHKDQTRTKEAVMLESLLKEGRHHSVFIVGDASMAPNELHGYGARKSGFDYLREMAAAFPRLAWLNPVREGVWSITETIRDIRTVARMFPLTPRGIERAVTYLNQFSARNTEQPGHAFLPVL